MTASTTTSEATGGLTPSSACEVVWSFSYTAQVNQLYYEQAKAIVGSLLMAFKLGLHASAAIGAGLAIVSLVKPDAVAISETSFAIGVLAYAAGLFVELVPLSRLHSHTSKLREEWTEFRGRADKLLVSLDALPQDKAVTVKMVARIHKLQDVCTAIAKSEGVRLTPWLRRCQKAVNRRTYHVPTGTHAEVLVKLESDKASKSSSCG